MKKQCFLLGALLLCSSLNAQEAITPEVLKTLSDSYQNTATDKALKNAISANPIKNWPSTKKIRQNRTPTSASP